MTDQSRELDALRAFAQETPHPSSETSSRIRRDILTRIAESAGDVRPWYKRHRLAVMGAGISGAVAAATFAVVAFGIPQPPHQPDAASEAARSVSINPVGETLRLAAAYAAAQPFPQTRPDQWAYVELKIVHLKSSEATIRQSWYRLDGKQLAFPNSSGGIDIVTSPGEEGRVGPKPALDPHDYATLVGMPSDPVALLNFLRTGLEPVADPNLDRNGGLFGLIGYILRENVLPPDVSAALLRAAATIPGVTQIPGTVIIDGRPATAVGLVDGWSREDILLDRDTHEFIGSRSVAVGDEPDSVAVEGEPISDDGSVTGPRVFSPGPLARKGDIVFLITRGDCRIVDAPGQTS